MCHEGLTDGVMVLGQCLCTFDMSRLCDLAGCLVKVFALCDTFILPYAFAPCGNVAPCHWRPLVVPVGSGLSCLCAHTRDGSLPACLGYPVGRLLTCLFGCPTKGGLVFWMLCMLAALWFNWPYPTHLSRLCCRLPAQAAYGDSCGYADVKESPVKSGALTLTIKVPEPL